MNELVKVESGKVVTSSLVIAEVFEKRHDHILRDIKSLDCSKEFRLLNFGESYYTNSQNREMPCYAITKDGFSFLVMGFTGKKAAEFKEKYIKAFNDAQKKQQPKDYISALKVLIAKEEEKLLLENKVENLSTALDTLVEWVSIIKVAKFNKVKETKFNWRKLKAKSKDLGFAIKKAESPRFGYQNLYNVNVFKACYPKYRYDFI